METPLKERAVAGFSWTIAQQVVAQGIRFVVSILLARQLEPADFGIIGLLGVLVAVGNTLVDSGMASSLIRSEHVHERDYSVVFTLNFFVALVVYGVFLAAASFIAWFFSQPLLKSLVPVFCLSFLIRSFSIVQATRLAKQLDFKKQFSITLPSLIVGSLVGLLGASLGFGVWSLVALSLAESGVAVINYWWRSDLRPVFLFDKGLVRKHLSFGYRITLVNLLEVLFKNLNQVLIGRFFSLQDLGLYSRAHSLKQFPVDTVTTALNKVSYPLLSNIQQDTLRLKSVYSQLLKQIVFWVSPFMIFMAVLANPLFRLLLTEKWMDSVPFFQILCFVGLLYPVHLYNLNILNVKGRSDLFLRVEAIKKIVSVVVLASAIQFGLHALVWSELVLSLLIFFANSYYSGSLIGYSTADQLEDIGPLLALALLASGVVFAARGWLYASSDLVQLLVSASLGVGFYLGVAFLLKAQPLMQVLDMVRHLNSRIEN